MKAIGIYREKFYSPNRAGSDAAILQEVARILLERGHEVSLSDGEGAMTETLQDAEIVFSMSRSDVVLRRLKEREERNAVVINPPCGVENCRRRRMTELLTAADVPYPESLILPTEKDLRETSFTLSYPCWLKRADAHAIEKDDVCYVPDGERAATLMESFAERGIKEAVISEHLQGDLIKFYGVDGTGFFHWFYPTSFENSKFGLKKYNGKPQGYTFLQEHLTRIASRASRVLRVPVYGGDAVVSDNGEIRLIDFNDWPSFFRCRMEAAEAIVERMVKQTTPQ